MKLGTIVYDNEIYNLDYMNSQEIKNVFDLVENAKKETIQDTINNQKQR